MTKVILYSDQEQGWMIPYLTEWVKKLSQTYDVELIKDADQLRGREYHVLFLLSCTRIMPSDILKQCEFNFVIHESKLPEGKGWSPMTWQIEAGIDRIPITLFKASEELDAGDIAIVDYIELDGTEVYSEWKHKQALKTFDLVLQCLEQYPDYQFTAQDHSQSTSYPRRTSQDDELDITQSLEILMNQLRVSDYENFPSWFNYRGRKFKVQVEPIDSIEPIGSDESSPP